MNPGQRKFAVGLIAAVAVLLAVLYLWSGPMGRDKVEALGEVARTVGDADMHHAVVIECGGQAFRARHNHDVITRVAGYVATIGSNTSVYMAVAEAAADADAECPVLHDLLDLALMKQSESVTLMNLIRVACEEKSPPDQAFWTKAYQEMYESRDYETVEEALAVLQKG